MLGRGFFPGRAAGKDEGRAGAQHAFDFDKAAGFLGGALDDGQAEAGALVFFLRCEKWLEDARQNVRCDAATGVAHAATGEGLAGRELVARGEFGREFDDGVGERKAAAAGHGILSVDA